MVAGSRDVAKGREQGRRSLDSHLGVCGRRAVQGSTLGGQNVTPLCAPQQLARGSHVVRGRGGAGFQVWGPLGVLSAGAAGWVWRGVRTWWQRFLELMVLWEGDGRGGQFP